MASLIIKIVVIITLVSSCQPRMMTEKMMTSRLLILGIKIIDPASEYIYGNYYVIHAWYCIYHLPNDHLPLAFT